MAQINKNEVTKELIEKAMQCKTVEELMAAAKTEGFDITKEEAEAYLAEIADVEVDEEKLKKLAGGGCYTHCPGYNDCWDCTAYNSKCSPYGG